MRRWDGMRRGRCMERGGSEGNGARMERRVDVYPVSA